MTVGALVDRMFRDYLANPADTPVQVQTQSLVSDVATTVTYSDEMMAEEVSAIGPGTVVELGLEMLRVIAHDENTRVLTVTRGLYGTDVVEHPAGTLMRVAPRWPRRVVFDAIADEIVSLYPAVYAEGSEWGDAREGLVEINDAYAVSVLEARQLDGHSYEPVVAELVRVADVSTGIAVQFEGRSGGSGDVLIRYARTFPRPNTEDVTLASLGIDPSWDRIILFGALMSLIFQPDVDAVTQEFVSEALENQGFPPSTGAQLAVTLARLRQTMLMAAGTRLRARNSVTTVYRREL